MDYLKIAKRFKTKKKLGQNFLLDKNIINTIINKADLTLEDSVLEIGSGIGFVTEEIAKRVKKVYAVEIDKDALKVLKQLDHKNIEVINQDILKFDISSLPEKKIKVIGNIPYSITSPILVRLLGEIDEVENKNRQKIQEIILTVQYEVAKRLIANEKSPSKEYGLISILTRFWSEPEFVCKVPAKCFYPVPKVDSAVIKLKVREGPLLSIQNLKLFRRITKTAFNTRRKNIKNSLIKGGFETKLVAQALNKVYIDRNRRAETISIKEYGDLTLVIDDIGSSNRTINENKS